jgi:hypothetical protein
MKHSLNEYGKTPLNPIRVSGIQASIDFLDSLVTEDEKPFLYHRVHTTSIGNSKPIDCYEILKADNSAEILLIDTYCPDYEPEIPSGYIRNSSMNCCAIFEGVKVSKTTGVNYKLRNFPSELINILKK